MDSKVKALALFGIVLAVGGAFAVAYAAPEAEARPNGIGAWRFLLQVRRAGAYVYRNGEPAQLTGKILGHIGPVLGVEADGAKTPVIMPLKWTLNGEPANFRQVAAALKGKQATIDGLKVERPNARIKTVYLAKTITADGVTAMAILPVK